MLKGKHPSPPRNKNFAEVAGGMQVIFRKNIYSEDYLKQSGLNERQIEAFEYVKKNVKITISDYQNHCKVSEGTALRDLEELVVKDIFQKKGEKKGTFYELNSGG